jgi:hypothetical protein
VIGEGRGGEGKYEKSRKVKPPTSIYTYIILVGGLTFLVILSESRRENKYVL